MKDYSKLEGKKVKIINSEDYSRGVVDGCDYDIGITISSAYNKKDHYCCLNGKSSPNYKRSPFRTKKQYDKMFNFIVDEIEQGVCNLNKGFEVMEGIIKKNMALSSQAQCGFSQ